MFWKSRHDLRPAASEPEKDGRPGAKSRSRAAHTLKLPRHDDFQGKHPDQPSPAK
jgi:hypothetical protein